MSSHSRTIFAALIVAVIAFCLGYGIAPRQAEAPAGPAALPADAVVTPMTIISIRETASTSPTVIVEYPQFPSLPADFNAEIASATLSRLADFRQEVAENSAARDATSIPSEDTASLPLSAYSFEATWQPAQMNSAHVSFAERYDSFVGGANDDEDMQTFDYDIAAGRDVTLGDLFPGVSDYLSKVSALARQQLGTSMEQASGGNISTDMLDQGTAPVPENFADFTFTDYQINLYFPKCDVAACSFGEQSVTIPVGSVK